MFETLAVFVVLAELPAIALGLYGWIEVECDRPTHARDMFWFSALVYLAATGLFAREFFPDGWVIHACLTFLHLPGLIGAAVYSTARGR